MQRRFRFLLVSGALVWSGCQVERLVIEEPVRDRLVEVHTDDHVMIYLDENTTTGYRWRAECPDPLVDITIEHEGAAPADARVGATGQAIVHLRICRGFLGPSCVSLRYQRSWSGACARAIKLQLHRRNTDVAVWK